MYSHACNLLSCVQKCMIHLPGGAPECSQSRGTKPGNDGPVRWELASSFHGGQRSHAECVPDCTGMLQGH